MTEKAFRCRLWANIFLMLLGFLVSSAHATEVIKSASDDRHYRYLELPNQLQVLLISDPEADKAAAALDVSVGSLDDPRERQGLAHFLEHMLFLGTEKYPEPDAYQAYVNAHGGSHNAYTALEHTNYFFDINAGHLDPGLDRFAQFFVQPLFRAEYVERERKAVHSEYQARLKDEYQRTLDVYRQVVNPEHPLTKFSVGNLSTLSNEDGGLRQDLMVFYRSHYNARAMGLVVLGREDLDQLEAMVEERFSEIPNRANPAEAADEDSSPGSARTPAKDESPPVPLFLPEDLPARVAIQPAREVRELSLLFPIPPVAQLYRKKPVHYLSNLLGHEGEGSLLSVLKGQGWANGLSAGPSLSTQNEALFEINIELTKSGLSQQQTIIGLVFAAIDRLAKSGIEEWRFAELQQLGEMAFRFQEQAPPLATVRSLAHNLHYYRPADVIAGDYLLEAYAPDLIKHFAAYLNPDNAMVTITAPGVEAKQTTPYFSTPYSVETSPMALAGLSPKLVEQLQLPEANPFIPQDLGLKPRPVTSSGSAQAADDPRLLKDAARIRVWFKQDQLFDLPRVSAFLRIKSPEAASSLEGAALTHLFAAMVRDALNEYAYPASLAGMSYSLQANSRGLDLVVSGYDDGQDELFKRIVQRLHTPRFSEQRLASVKNGLLRQWRNIELEPPYEQLIDAMPTVLFSPWWSRQRRIDSLSGLTIEDLNRFAKSVFVDSRAELLLYGNLTRSEAAKLAGLVEVELLSAMAGKVLPPAKVVKLEPTNLEEPAPVFVESVNHNDNAAILYLQGHNDSLQESARALLLRQVLRTPFFHELRTEQQLGYAVFMSPMPFKDVPGTVMVVQSPVASTHALMSAMGKFVAEGTELVPEDLAQHKSAVAKQLLESPENLHEQASRYWESILRDDKPFNRRERLARAVMAVDSEELNAYFQRALVEQSRALWLLAGMGVRNPHTRGPAKNGPGQNDESSRGKNGDEALDWMPINESPQFKAERDSYIYPG